MPRVIILKTERWLFDNGGPKITFNPKKKKKRKTDSCIISVTVNH
jgi:hypothetical protein